MMKAIYHRWRCLICGAHPADCTCHLDSKKYGS